MADFNNSYAAKCLEQALNLKASVSSIKLAGAYALLGEAKFEDGLLDHARLALLKSLECLGIYALHSAISTSLLYLGMKTILTSRNPPSGNLSTCTILDREYILVRVLSKLTDIYRRTDDKHKSVCTAILQLHIAAKLKATNPELIQSYLFAMHFFRNLGTFWVARIYRDKLTRAATRLGHSIIIGRVHAAIMKTSLEDGRPIDAVEYGTTALQLLSASREDRLSVQFYLISVSVVSNALDTNFLLTTFLEDFSQQVRSKIDLA